jgi:Zn-dependent M28 family amino/carboxypeptidase
MLIRRSLPLRRAPADTDRARWLRAQVESLAVPRHATWEAYANRSIADRLARAFEDAGLRTFFQGPDRNVVGLPRSSGPVTLVGAHYDSVPDTPGADDNASALAVLLSIVERRLPGVGFIAFNREEDGLVGSRSFVAWLETSGLDIADVHILEMVGYTDPRPGAQRLPAAIPGFLAPTDRGDFLGVVGLGCGHRLADRVRRVADGALGVPPVISLQTPLMCVHVAPDLGLSDHLPFVQMGRSAVMWTDTAYLRTPHYHQLSDTPETLDYAFMAEVETLLARVLETAV